METEKKIEMITLMGSKEGTLVEMNKSRHVLLSDGWYEKKDLRYVTNIDGLHYRVNSPLITKLSATYYGAERYALTKDVDFDVNGHACISSDLRNIDFLLIDLDSKNSGRKTLRVFYQQYASSYNYYPEGSDRCVGIRLLFKENGIFVGRTIDIKHSLGQVGLCITTSPVIAIFHISDCYTLHSSYKERNYPKALWSKGIVDIGGDLHVESHIQFSLDTEGNNYKPIRNAFTGHKFNDVSTTQCSICMHVEMKAFKEETLDVIESGKDIGVLSKEHRDKVCVYVNNFITQIDRFVADIEVDNDFNDKIIHTDLGFSFCRKSDFDFINRIIEICNSDTYRGKYVVPFILKSESKSWLLGMDTDPSTNPIMINNNKIGDTGGDFVWFKPKEKTPLEISSSVNNTGGIGYTFGVELETSYGYVPKPVCRNIGVSAVGDRSIGMLEYVTPPLHGNKGIRKLDNIVDIVSKYTLTDDRCGIHVHVGGAEGADTPWFSRNFSAICILLGTQIEKELFSLLPDNRMLHANSSGESYCGSILHYKDRFDNFIKSGMTKIESYRSLLSEYVMGRDRGDFNIQDFVSNKVPDNKGLELNRWAPSRYKWLNLINCNTDNSNRRGGSGGFRTIEFRAFNGTLNRDDIRWFVLFSLAFTRFAHKNKIAVENSGVTISDIINFSVSDGESVYFMKKWIEDRKVIIKKARKQNTTK